MMKRFAMFAMVAGLLVGANNLYAQCSGEKAASGKSCCAAKKKEGAAISQMKIVDKDQVSTLISKNEVVVVDARDEASFSAGHINGAILLASNKLPADKNAKLVFYCGSERCPASTKAAKKALEAGYKNVMVYRGGWADWSKNS